MKRSMTDCRLRDGDALGRLAVAALLGGMVVAFGASTIGWLAAPGAAGGMEAGERVQTYESPSKRLVVERRWKDEGGSQLWVRGNSVSRAPILLLDSPRHATPVFFESDTWLVVNHHLGSNESRALVFRRRDDGSYDAPVDITAEAWKFFEEQTGRSSGGLDHEYCSASVLTESPRALLIRLRGDRVVDAELGGGERVPVVENLGPWFCIYLVDEASFHLDLTALNRAAGDEG